MLVFHSSRVSRDRRDQHYIFKRLKFEGIRYISITQGIDSASSQSDLLLGFHGIMDDKYLDDLAENVHRGAASTVLRGNSPGGGCYGYDRIPPMTPKSPIRWKVNMDQAEVLRRIFTMAADGRSLKGIAKTVNAEHVPRSLTQAPRSPRSQSWRLSGKLS